MLAEICVDELMVECLIGCLDTERTHAQVVRVDLAVTVDILRPADSDSLRQTWNYAAIAEQVRFVLQQGRFHLLESAARALLRSLLVPPAPDEDRPAAQQAWVSLTKFGVLPGQARPRVRLAGRAEEQRWVQEVKPWGSVDVIDENRRMGLYRLNIAPGCTLPNHIHRTMREAEMVLTSGLVGWASGSPELPLPPGRVQLWRAEQPHGYRNPGAQTASLLCIDAPPFDPADEIEVPR